jgi:hypothetical protein
MHPTQPFVYEAVAEQQGRLRESAPASVSPRDTDAAAVAVRLRGRCADDGRAPIVPCLTRLLAAAR